MLAYVIGVTLFVAGLCLSLALHEAGHLVSARVFGMRVRRYRNAGQCSGLQAGGEGPRWRGAVRPE